MTPISELRAFAKSEKRPVRRVNVFDSDACYELNATEALNPTEPPADRLRYEVRVLFANRRFVIQANDRYLAIMVRGEFATGVFSINRPSNFMTFFYGEMRKCDFVGEHPVFVPLNDPDPAALQALDVRELALKLRMESAESLRVFRNGISAYICPRPNRALTEILGTLAELAEAIPPDRDEPLQLNELPDQFRPLIPMIRKWGISDDRDREEQMRTASRKQLMALVRRVSPLFGDINVYLAGFAGEMPGSATALGSLAETAAEAKLLLQKGERRRNR